MQRNLALRYFILLFFFLLSSPFVEQSWCIDQVKAGPVDITLEPILSSQWVSYIQEEDLFIRSTEGASLKIRSKKDTIGAIMSPSLKVMGNSIFLAWIEKGQGGNKVLFVSSQDNGKSLGKSVELATNAKSSQVRILTDSEGRLYVIEASAEKEPGVVINLSLDKGEAFKRIPLELKELEFLYNLASVTTNDMLYLFLSGVKEGKNQVGVKPFEVNSLKPHDYTMIKETEQVSFLDAFVIKNRPAVIYKTAREGKFVLEGAVKGDKGWELFSIKDAEGLDVARIDYHAWEDGRVLVVFSGEEREKFKQRIYAAVSEDLGRNWDLRRLDKKEFDNTRAWLPRMAVDGDKVVVVWEDSRDIRSGVRMKLSSDRGKTWREQDIPLSDAKKYAFRPKIGFSNGSFYAAWDQYRDDEKKVADLAMVKLKWDEMLKMESRKPKVISPKKKEALLRERVNAYWKGMLKKNMKVTYEIHDPFYRARIPFDYYASHRGPMVYHRYSLEEVRIEGNVATVKIKVNYDVPKIMILGKETSIPPKEVLTEDTYLFIDNKWFRKFVDAMSGGSAIDY